MEEGNNNDTCRSKWSADFGGDREFVAEFEGDHVHSVALSGIQSIDTWMRAEEGGIDLRVRIRRTSTGIEVTVDRGQQPGVWWREGRSPQLAVSIDDAQLKASAVARVEVDGQPAELAGIIRL